MQEHEAVYEAILDAVHNGQSACVVTVVETRGSTPRGVGAKMLLRTDGSTVGTIGGGALEAAALDDAKKALTDGQSRIGHYSLLGETEEDLGVCGGEASVFVEVLRPKPTLLIVGAGHVGQPLAELGHVLGFRTVVVDDRPEFANLARFPNADELVVTPLGTLTEQVTITPRTFVIIATRGHEHDAVVLRQVVSSLAGYIGMIGSRRKVRSVFEHLLAGGVSKESLARVYAPIGLRTGGRTPAEIAVSILAEIVLVQHDGSGEPLSWRDNPMRAGHADDGGISQL